ncbi:hypothetical protein [Methylopila sp. 73B]|uniref:hypothetical protein n=1 Tax=Methylopila sp. 73B TaxID=1120792 RepID=UPI0018CC0019|nr:hypothetical protein [Methylopila sp. 73B]
MAQRRTATFTQAEVSRILKGAKAAGVPIRGVEVDRNGKIVVLVGEPQDQATPANPWDEVLQR